MKEIVSKFSLYDILAMVIPGGTMLLYISLSLLGATLVFDSTVSSNGIAWIIILITSYLLGLLNMCFTNYLFSSFRNNSGMLAESFKRALHKEPQLSRLNKYGKIVDEALNSPNNIIEIASVILKYLAYLSVIFIENKLIYNSCRPLSAGILILICAIIIPAVFVFSNNSHGKDVQSIYYSAYYYALKNRYSNDIPILEAQVAFLQSMIMPLSLLFFIPEGIIRIFFPNIEMCTIHLLLLLIIIGMFFTIYYRQMKIYQRVWEDYEYLHQCNEDSDNLNVLNNKKIIITNSHIDIVMSSDSIRCKQHKN